MATTPELPTASTADLAFHPIRYHNLDRHYQFLKTTFWHHGELDLSQDRNDWKAMDENTKAFIKTILCLFAQLDGIVNENLLKNFQEKTGFIKEANHFYAMQAANETIHNETYSVLLETFIADPIERQQSLDAIKHFPAIAKIAEWAYDWMKPERSLLEQLVAFVCIEGIIFQNPFAGIYYIKNRNKLPGLTLSNEWISRDEAIHTYWGMDLKALLEDEYRQFFPKITQERVYEIVKGAVNVSTEFTSSAMKVDLVGLKLKDMISYTECTADTLLAYMGYDELYKTQNPFDWMALIAMPNKSNFFEKKVSEYSRSAVGDIEWDNLGSVKF
jgi:ribonucleotide reductase beta subunit family protein with ferritin-like domain